MRAAGRQVEVFDTQKCDDLIEIYRRTGWPEDFEQIVRRFAALVLSETRRVTRNSHDAEDASQLAFLALAMEIKSGTNILRVGPWLQRVSRRQALKIVRSRGRRQRREDAVRKSEMHLVDTGKPLDQAVAAGIIRDAIDQLPDRYRLPLVLHYFGGMTLEMIAAEMKITRQTVGTRLHRGRKMLATKLSKQGVVFDALMLASMISLLVPAAVVEGVMRSTGGLHGPPGTATLPAAVTQILRTVSFASIQKTLRVALIAAALASAGSGMAWAVHTNWSSLLKPTQAMQWLQRALRFHPQWNFSFSQNPAVSSSASADAANAKAALEISSQRIPFDPPWADSPTPQSTKIATKTPTAIAKSNPAPKATEQNDSLASITSATPFHVESFTPAVTNLIPASSQAVTHPIATNTATSTKPQASIAPHVATATPTVASPAPLILGTQSNSTQIDSMMLAAGNHQFSSIDVGESGHAALAIAEAATVSAPEMRVAVQPGSSGTVTQHGGNVDVGSLTIGDAGTAKYYVDDGGKIDVTNLVVANQAQSDAQFTIASGRADIAAQGDVTIGNQGKGSLLVGSVTSAGTVYSDANTVPLVIRDQPQAQGLVLGWGAVGTGGTLVNNGRVVADGFDQVRTLDLTNFSTVENTIDNPPDGNNGWFVQRGGRITLPAFQITPSQQTYTWGESSDDPTIDLVNSLRMNVLGQKTPATVSMTLRTATAADPLSVPLPTDVTLISLWQITAQQFDPSQVGFSVRYDATDANIFAIDGRSVGLFAYNSDGQWQSADGGWVDPADRIVGGDFDGSISYLAVGVEYSSTIQPQSFTPVMDAALIHSTITPEPSGIAFLLLGSACLLKRSRSGRWS